MICPKCKKNTVEILLNEDDNYEHIICKDCKWEITITSGGPVVRFFLLNYDLELVFREGRSAYVQGLSIVNNPWNFINEEDKHDQWAAGWNFGNLCMEKLGFFPSPCKEIEHKIEEQQKMIEDQQEIIEKLMEEKTLVNSAIFEFTQSIKKQ